MHYERALEIWDRVAPGPGELPLERLEVLRRAAEVALMTGEEERAITLASDLLARIDEHDDPIGAALAYERSAGTYGSPGVTRTRCRVSARRGADARRSAV